MQHPVGVQLVDGRPTMVDFWAILTNSTALAAWSHALAGAVAVAGGFLLGISWYQLWQRRRDGIDTVDGDGRVQIGEASTVAGRDRTDHHVWLSSLRVGAIVAIIGFTAVAISGDFQAKLMYQQQPMKMAAAEAACHTGTSFSLLTVGNIGTSDCENVVTLIEIPGVLSFLAHGDFTTELPGIKDLIPKYETTYGIELSNDPMFGDRAGSDVHYVPIMWVTYWGFRMMIGFGVIAAFAAVVALWLTRKGTVPRSGWLMRLAVAGILAPFAANSAGWIFTEMGRQPFVVAPNPDLSGVDGVFMFTAAAVSPGVSGLELLISTIALTATYAVLAAVEMFILVRYVRGGVASAMPKLGDDTDAGSDDNGDVLAFAY